MGKPRLVSPGRLEFNLSHSGDHALLAVSRERPVGVDIEVVRPIRERDSIVSRYFTDAERISFDAVPPPLRDDHFFRLWTRKEAFLKALGVGLSGGLDRVEVGSGFVKLSAEGRDWSLMDLYPGSELRGAIAAEGDGWSVRAFGPS